MGVSATQLSTGKHIDHREDEVPRARDRKRVELVRGDIAAAARCAEAATVLAHEMGGPTPQRVPRSQARPTAEQVARPAMRAVLTDLRTSLATVRPEGGDRQGAEALIAAAQADAPRADVRARRRIDAAAALVRRTAPGRPIRA